MQPLRSTFTSLLPLILILSACTKHKSSRHSPQGKNPNAIAVPLIAIVNPLAPIQKKEFPLYTMTKDVLFGAFQIPGVAPLLDSMGISNSLNAQIPAQNTGICTEASNSPLHLCVRPGTVLAKMAQIQQSMPSPAELANYPDFSVLKALTVTCDHNQTLNDEKKTACIAAKLTDLLSGYPSLINNLLTLQNSLIASLIPAGRHLPKIGETLEAKTYLPDFKGLRISSATLSQLPPNRQNEAIWKTAVTAIVGESATLSFETYHIPENAENTAFRGLMKAVYPYKTPGSKSEKPAALSFKYFRNEKGDLQYELRVLTPKPGLINQAFTPNGLVNFSYSDLENNALKLSAKYNQNSQESVMNLDWTKSKFGILDKVKSLYIPPGREGKLLGMVSVGLAANQVQQISIMQSPSGSYTHTPPEIMREFENIPAVTVPYPFTNGVLPKN